LSFSALIDIAQARDLAKCYKIKVLNVEENRDVFYVDYVNYTVSQKKVPP